MKALREFDVSEVRQDATVLVIGKRRTGKSFLLKDLLYRHREIPAGTVISPRDEYFKCYGHIVPSDRIHYEYTPELLGKVVKRQRLAVASPCTRDPRAFLVIDFESCSERDLTRDPSVRVLLLNGRQLKVMCLIAVPYPLRIPPLLRSNLDYVFITRDNIMTSRVHLYEHYADMFPTFDAFNQVLNECFAEPRRCLVIRMSAAADTLEDRVFWYKAEAHEPFRMCSDDAGLDGACDGGERGNAAAAGENEAQ